jgi:hypothetical protein
MPKEAVVPEIGAWYQAHGVTALVYDTHGIGSSDGYPRFDTDPQKRVEDLHDAVTFLSTHPLVDETKIAIWGMQIPSASYIPSRIPREFQCSLWITWNSRDIQNRH